MSPVPSLNIFSGCSLFPPTPATEVSKENRSHLNPLISTMINSKYTRGIQATHVLLSLRLVGIQEQSLEQRLIQQVKDNERQKGECLYSLQ